MLCADVLLQRQADGCREIVSKLQPGGWWVLQVCWDETEFRVIPTGETAGVEGVSILGAHGHAVWCTDADTVPEEDELVLRPVPLEASTAEGLCGGLRSVLPSAWWPCLEGNTLGTRLGALCLGSDHARSNLRLMRIVESQAPANVLTPHGLCKQHAAGLCIARVVQYLQILCPAFCCAKQFRRANFYRAFRDAVSASVEQQLEWRQDPAFTQNPVDRLHSEAVLELAYYDRDLRTVSNEAEAETLRQAGQLRRRRGQELLDALPGCWKSATDINDCIMQVVCSRLGVVPCKHALWWRRIKICLSRLLCRIVCFGYCSSLAATVSSVCCIASSFAIPMRRSLVQVTGCAARLPWVQLRLQG
jgi:hypothetical protein